MYFLRPERVPGEKTSAPALPNRLLPFSFHFFRQFFWGCMGLLTLPVLGRAVFASIAYATKRLTDTVLAMHDPAAEAGRIVHREHGVGGARGGGGERGEHGAPEIGRAHVWTPVTSG